MLADALPRSLSRIAGLRRRPFGARGVTCTSSVPTSSLGRASGTLSRLILGSSCSCGRHRAGVKRVGSLSHWIPVRKCLGACELGFSPPVHVEGDAQRLLRISLGMRSQNLYRLFQGFYESLLGHQSGPSIVPLLIPLVDQQARREPQTSLESLGIVRTGRCVPLRPSWWCPFSGRNCWEILAFFREVVRRFFFLRGRQPSDEGDQRCEDARR